MSSSIFSLLNSLNDFIWGYLSFSIIILLGLYFTIKSKTFQVRNFFKILKTFTSKNKENNKGHHPVKILLTAIGGSIGVGNIIGIITAIRIGGPGALFWTWVAGFLGMILQYSEVYLGMKHRVVKKDGTFDGGPMHFLKKAYKGNFGKLAIFLVCIFLSIYAIEIFMFNVVSNNISINWHLNKYLVVFLFLLLIIFTVKGGINRISKAVTTILPIFLGLYFLMAFYILFKNYQILPAAFLTIFKAAFTKQAGIGGFAGSTIILTISMGLSRGAYAGDIGIGYNAIIHAQSSETNAKKQASLAIVGIFFNTFILCTISSLIVLLTGTWHENIDVTLIMQKSLSIYFPYMEYFMPLLLFLLSFLTLITYYFVGLRCAEYIAPKKGKYLYSAYAFTALPLFAFVETTQAFLIMSLCGAFLLLINLTGMFILRKEIEFKLK